MTPLRIGVIGLGRAFTLMVPTFARDPRVQIVAGFDPREAPRRRLASDFGAAAHGDAESLCADPRVEVVYVASPHQFHAPHVKLAASHGKHVLVEKPIAITLAECDEMIADCRRAGVQLVVGHCHSFDTPYLETRKLVQGGAFGAVRMMHALNYTDFMYRPRRPEELDTEEGGGVVFSQAAHQIDVLRLLAGGRVTRVRAATGRWDPGRCTEGAYMAMFWFDNGCFASALYSGYAHFDTDEWCGGLGEMGFPKDAGKHSQMRGRLSRIGSPQQEALLKAQSTYGGPAYRDAREEPLARAHQHFGPVIVSCEHADLRPTPEAIYVEGDDRREKLALPAPAVPRAEVIDELWETVRERRAALHDGEWARDTLACCLALLQSARENREVLLPPRCS